ncbi:hypothetical protein DFH28DRAFT_535732 [Melampsora americana]|nr:hypothetical protein DFH28DRAFT_535732 [Melampsora americana]
MLLFKFVITAVLAATISSTPTQKDQSVTDAILQSRSAVVNPFEKRGALIARTVPSMRAPHLEPQDVDLIDVVVKLKDSTSTDYPVSIFPRLNPPPFLMFPNYCFPLKVNKQEQDCILLKRDDESISVSLLF